jgi:hypothetical protein
MKKPKMPTLAELEVWVLNDEGWYGCYRAARQSLRTFVRDNKQALREQAMAIMTAKPREKTWRDHF